jgi:hypothetical protein
VSGTHIELYATGSAAPAAVWALVGNPCRLPEWTDAEHVEDLSAETPAVGMTFVTVAAGQRLSWRLVTAEDRTLEAVAAAPFGELAVGVRAAMTQGGGTRLVLVAHLDHPGGLRGLRIRLGLGATLRRRMDRWAHAALRLAG